MVVARVVVDDREKASGVPEELTKLGLRVYFSTLSVGDYVVSPEIVVERKTVRDLLSSIYDSRIFYQAAKVAATYAKPYLLVEGDSKQVSSLTKNIRAYYGAIAHVSIAYGLRMLYTADQSETALAILGLINQARARPVSRLPAGQPPKSKSVSQQQLYLIGSLPGIGNKLAENLLLKYGTARSVLSLTPGQLSMTPGIGWKRAERIKQLLDSRYSRFEGKEDQTKLGE